MDEKFRERAEIEIQKGRIPLWLNIDEITFIANEWRKIPPNIEDSDKKIWAQIAFKSMSALNHNGIKYEPKWPSDDQVYIKGRL